MQGSVCFDDGDRVRATGVLKDGKYLDYTCDEKRCWWVSQW